MDTQRTPHASARLATITLALLLVAAACGAADDSERADATSEGRSLSNDVLILDEDAEVSVDVPEAATFDEAADDIAGPEPSAEAAPLRAGSVDDNVDFARYLDYRARFADLGIPVRALDVSVRHVVLVTGDDGRPVRGEPVTVVADGERVGVVRTGTDGRALIHPRALGVAADTPIELLVDGAAVAPAADGPTGITIDRPGGTATPVPLDLYFIVDVTGSMGAELERLTATVEEVVERVTDLPGDPDVRLGLTVYRDEGDDFVTRTYDFTRDVAAFRAVLAEQRAAGGGDIPEALDEALAAALTEPTWRAPGDTVKLAFVVADAPPQVTRDVPMPYDVSLIEAAERGLRIYPVGATGTDDAAEYVFRQFAQFTGGRFVYLSHGVDGAALGPSTNIDRLADDELPLEDLLVRIVAEELANTLGEGPAEPATTTTTIDPRQVQGS